MTSGLRRLARRAAALATVVAAAGLASATVTSSPAGAAPVGTILGVQRGAGIFAMAADGSGLHILIPDSAAEVVAAAPIGGLLAYGDTGSPALEIATGAGDHVTSLSTVGAAGSVASIAWSPDGQQVAYTVCDTGTTSCEIELASVTGAWSTALASPDGIDPDGGISWGGPGLVVAGTFAAGTSCPGCSAGFYVLHPLTQLGPVPLFPAGAPTAPGTLVHQPAVSPDGSFAYTASAAGQDNRVLTTTASGDSSVAYGRASDPAWSPDASTLLFTNGYQVLESRPSIGGGAQIIATLHTFGVQSLAWLPGAVGATGCSVALPAGSVQAMAPAPNGAGYWVTDAYGDVSACGDTGDYGGLGAVHLNQPVLGIAPTPDGRGYWLVAYDGGVFSFGDAAGQPQNGAPGGPLSLGGRHLAAPIWAMAATRSGHGYLLAATDGGVFSFGDATFYGSAAAFRPTSPIVGMAPTPDGRGYWLATANGTVFAFGDAAGPHGGFLGPQSAPIVAVASDPRVPGGYWLVARDGTVYPFGGAPSLGSPPPGPHPSIRAMAATPDGTGYWLVDSSGTVHPFGSAVFAGNAN